MKKILMATAACILIVVLLYYSSHQETSLRAQKWRILDTNIGNRDLPVFGKQFDGHVIRVALEKGNFELPDRKMNCKPCSIPLVGVTIKRNKSPHADSIEKLTEKGITIIIVGNQEISQFGDFGKRENKNIIYFSVETQRRLYPQIGLDKSSNSIAVKNIGYLHAMKLGACRIYDFDEDNTMVDYSLLEKVQESLL